MVSSSCRQHAVLETPGYPWLVGGPEPLLRSTGCVCVRVCGLPRGCSRARSRGAGPEVGRRIRVEGQGASTCSAPQFPPLDTDTEVSRVWGVGPGTHLGLSKHWLGVCGLAGVGPCKSMQTFPGRSRGRWVNWGVSTRKKCGYPDGGEAEAGRQRVAKGREDAEAPPAVTTLSQPRGLCTRCCPPRDTHHPVSPQAEAQDEALEGSGPGVAPLQLLAVCLDVPGGSAAGPPPGTRARPSATPYTHPGCSHRPPGPV